MNGSKTKESGNEFLQNSKNMCKYDRRKSMHDDRILKQIDNGAIDYYYGLKFQTKLTFERLVDFIDRKTNLVLDGYFHAVTSSFQVDVQEAIKSQGLSGNIAIKDSDKNTKKRKKEIVDVHNAMDSIQFELTDTGFKINATPKIQKHIQHLFDRSTTAYEQSKTIYGDSYVNAQTRIILPPFVAVLSNGESVFLESILYVFTNKSAVLRLTVPLKKVNSQPLFENDLDVYISSFEDVCGIGVSPDNNSIDSLKKCYCDFLVKDMKKTGRILSVGKIVSIILSKHSAMIKDVKNISENLQEDIYRILIAPILNRKNIDYLDDAQKCFDNMAFALNGTCSVFNKMNKCVTVMDDSIIEAGKEIYKEDVYEYLIDDIRNGVEFAFCVLMLKKINNQYTFFTKRIGNGEESKIQNEYNSDRIFISLLLGDTYGSVREQVEFFEQSMKYFIDTQNSNERLESINNILGQKNANKIQTLQNVLSVGGLVFSVLFGLPAITDTVVLLRRIFSFVETDIPMLTVDNFSFGLWLLVNVIIACFVLLKGKKH